MNSTFVKLGDIADLTVGYVGNMTQEYKEEGVYFFRSLNIKPFYIDKTDLLYISSEFNEKIKKSKLNEGDLVIVRTGQPGTCCVIPKEYDGCNCSDLVIVRPNQEFVNPYYLEAYINFMAQKQINHHQVGAIQKHFNVGSAKEMLVFLPDRDKQERIANLIRNINSKIENNNKINAELESMAKTIYDYWFLQFEFPNEEGKPYKSSGGKTVWNEELKSEIPEGWEVTTIGDVTVCHDSKRIPLTGNEREEIKGNIPYYGATGIMGYVNRPIFDGDYVLVAEDGSVMDAKGNPIIQRASGKIWVNNHAHVLEPIKNYSCKLLMMILKNIPVASIKTGSIQMKINQENLNKVKILDIPNEIKKQINKQLETIDKMILENNKENQELASLRDFLLPLLMNGQVGFKE